MIKIKRVYERPEPEDGLRVLVDRLWPRGLSKDTAKIDKWMRDIAPSAGLRKWFGHKQERWKEFERRYFEELRDKGALLLELKALSKKGNLTLLYGAKDTERNNARALLKFIRNLSAFAQKTTGVNPWMNASR